ncbi:hypothetical protein RKD46_002509 [Streptomyces pseudovenezuelae]
MTAQPPTRPSSSSWPRRAWSVMSSVVDRLLLLLVLGAAALGDLVGRAEADGQPGEAGGPAGQEADDGDHDDGGDGGALARLGLGDDRGEGGEDTDAGAERGGDEGRVVLRQHQDEQDGGDEDDGEADKEVEPARALARVQAHDAGAADHQVRQRGESEGDGRVVVVVDTRAYGGQRDQDDAGDAGDDAGQAVHVVAQRLGEPQGQRHHGQQQRAGGQADDAHHAVVPAAPVGLHDGGHGVDDVVEDGGRQRVRERPQKQQFAIAYLLFGERAAVVQDGTVPAYEVVPGGRGLFGSLSRQPQDLRVDVRERHVLGKCHVDPAVRCRHRDPAESGC